jgi:hypothetical protein
MLDKSGFEPDRKGAARYPECSSPTRSVKVRVVKPNSVGPRLLAMAPEARTTRQQFPTNVSPDIWTHPVGLI